MSSVLDTPCLEATHVAHNGYGVRYTAEAMEKFGTNLLHRQIMMMVHGREVVEGSVVMHVCDNPKCFRYSHLELGSQSDNLKDMAAKGRQWNQKKTHCHRGHEFDEENTYAKPGGGRECRACARNYKREWKRRRRRGS